MSPDASAVTVEIGLLTGTFAFAMCCGRAQGRRLMAVRLHQKAQDDARLQAQRVQRWVRPVAPTRPDGSPFALLSAYEDAVVSSTQFNSRVGYSTDDEQVHVPVAAQLDREMARLRLDVLTAMGDDPKKIHAFYEDLANMAGSD